MSGKKNMKQAEALDRLIEMFGFYVKDGVVGSTPKVFFQLEKDGRSVPAHRP